MTMKTKFLLSFLALVGLVFATPTTHAQTYQPSNRAPVADNTLGTQVLGTGNNFTITGGLSKGQTLFQSFSDFSVPTNGQANFLNPAGNRDIITRVTGNLFSDINGTVNTNGANFFLINPNGIVFGNNARLDVGKAFVGSTANSIDLVNGNGGRITFGTNLNGDALLKVAPNVLFDVSRLNLSGGNGAISNFGTLQTPNNSQYIGLFGGNVTLDGSMGGGKIIAPGGRIDMGGLNSAGTISVDNNGLVFSGSGLRRSDVSLIDGAGATVRATDLSPVNTFFNNGTSSSSINISANNIDFLNPSAQIGALAAGWEANLGSQTIPTGDIKLDATGEVNLDNAAIRNTLRAGTQAKIGDIKIRAGNLDINNSVISSTTSGIGNAGNIDITTSGGINITNDSNISSDNAKARGHAGDINIIATGDIKISGYDASSINPTLSQITSNTDGLGDAGKITIDTQGKLSLINDGSIRSSIVETGVGNSQGIKITARELSLANGSFIFANTLQTERVNGKGNAGDINIKTTGDIKIAGFDPFSINPKSSQIASNTFGQGATGEITIDTQGKLSLSDLGIVSSSIGENGVGNSQGIKITARELSLANRSSINTNTSPTARGNAGDIDIKTTENINIVGDLSGISSNTEGQGNAGRITIDTQGKLSLINQGVIGSTIAQTAVGNGLGLSINAREIALTESSFIGSGTLQAAEVAGTGKAGDINLNVQGSIQADNSSQITTTSTGTGQAGNINLNARGTILGNNSSISTSSFSTEQAGNISITSDRLILNRGNVASLGDAVTGGNITILISDKLLMQNNSFITSLSGSIDKNGNGGNITISSPLIIALPGNNDITADAIQGTGGNVQIDSKGLFGIQYRSIRSEFTNDITASSIFGQNGAVNIDTPGTDPGKNNTELPQVPTDASNQISQACSASNRENKLTVAGRGGLPPNADDLLTPNIVWRDARATNSQPRIGSVTTPAQTAPPAVGWLLDGKGKVTLVAAVTNGQPTVTSVVCPQTTLVPERS
jgi:filamentous hemagglutinin family protein